jgi:hypothetical protein
MCAVMFSGVGVGVVGVVEVVVVVMVVVGVWR